jgi:hypothetical protein
MKRLSLLLLFLIIAVAAFAQTTGEDGFNIVFPAAFEFNSRTNLGIITHDYHCSKQRVFDASVQVQDWSQTGSPLPDLTTFMNAWVGEGKLTSSHKFLQQGIYPALAFEFTRGPNATLVARSILVKGTTAFYLATYVRLANSDDANQTAFLKSFSITINAK